ncbi:MAG: hypothetical protein GY772_09420, partial [bacterium]|nr:hypothetical protein [bacterium]
LDLIVPTVLQMERARARTRGREEKRGSAARRRVELVGLHVDAVKCFDKLPWDISEHVLGKAGLAKGVLRGLMSYERSLERHMAVGAHFHRRGIRAANGFGQGSAMSILPVLLNTTVWQRVLEARGFTGKAFAYVDDRNLVTDDPAELQRAFTDTVDYDASIGAEINLEPGKTEFWAIGDDAAISGIKISARAGKPLGRVAIAKVVGFQLFAKANEGKVMQERLEKAAARFERIAGLPQQWPVRTQVAAAAAGAVLTYGAWAAPPNGRRRKDARQKAAKCLWRWEPTAVAREILFTVLAPGHRVDL